MPIFSRAELAQRQRLFLVVAPSLGSVEPDSIFGNTVAATATTHDLSAELAKLWAVQLGDGGRVGDLDVPRGVRALLSKGGVALLRNAEPLLACVSDPELDHVWKRLFTETIDVSGFGVILLRENSTLLPSPNLEVRFEQQVRRLTP